MNSESFAWPGGKRAALSLTFDDARVSQVDRGLPVLNQHQVKATFYVSPAAMLERHEAWKQAVADGHEIGNHTLNHPCSGNFGFARSRPLEDYTLDAMERELTGATELIERELGVRPTTFAYPCGQTFVGRGDRVQSYVPLVARHFTMGRVYRSESPFSPVHGDLAQAFGVHFDGTTISTARAWMERTISEGGWLILAGHEVGAPGPMSVDSDTLRFVCEFASDPGNGLWIDTAADVAAYVGDQARA